MIIGTFKDDTDALIEISWEEVTPDLARQWLEANVDHNRNLNNLQVYTIAEDINDGFWRFNGATVCFDWDGKLLDAQHRLNAVALSDTPVSMLVLRGMNPESMKLMGQDRPRSTRDLLKTSGRAFDHDSETIAVASIIVQSDPGLAHVNTRPRLADFVYERREAMEPVAAWAKTVVRGTDLFIDPAHAFSNGKQDRKAVTNSALGGLVYIMGIIHGAEIDRVTTFWEHVFSGIATSTEEATYVKAIRNYLRVTAPLVRVGGGSSVTQLFRTYDTLIRAYNRFVQSGEPIQRLQQARVPATDLTDLTRTVSR